MRLRALILTAAVAAPALGWAQQGHIIHTIAGGGPDQLPKLEANLFPRSIATDSNGNLYVSESCRVYKIGTDGILRILAGTGWCAFAGDGGAALAADIATVHIASDAAGNVFFVQDSAGRVRRVDAVSGVITTVAGNGNFEFSGDGGPATAAGMSPSAMDVDAFGNLFIVDGPRVRRVDAATGVITTIAGTGTMGFSGDGGPATSAEFGMIADVAVSPDGSLLIADGFNNFRVRRVDTNGTVNTVAGNGEWTSGGDGGPALSAGIGPVAGIAADATGFLLFTNFDPRVRRVDAGGVINAFAGMQWQWEFSGDGGPATEAGLFAQGLATDAAGHVYIAEGGRIRRVEAGTGIINTFAGNGSGFCGDGYPGPQGCLAGVRGLAVTPGGHLLAGDGAVYRVRRIEAGSGLLSTVVGTGEMGSSGDGGPATEASLYQLSGVASDSAGNFYLSDAGSNRIRRVDAASGIIDNFAGAGAVGYGGDGGPAASAVLNQPADVALDASGNVYIADMENHRIRRVDAVSGIISTVAGTGLTGFSGDGGQATSARLHRPTAVALDSTGRLYILDERNRRVRRVGTDGVITTVAGNGTQQFVADGVPATSTGFMDMNDMAVTPADTILVLDQDSLRHVDADGIITTVAGNALPGFGGDGGPASGALLARPASVEAEASGSIYVADQWGTRIRKIANAIPSAHAAGPYSGSRNQAIVFDGLGSADDDGDGLRYRWDFGDGSTGTGSAPHHVYAALGNYTVTLVVDDGLTVSAPATATVTISNQAPTADAGPDQTLELGGGSVVLSGSGFDPDDDDLTYEWRDQGGVVVATTASFSVSLGLGSYDYTLTVDDGNGGSDDDDVHVVVQDTTAPLVDVTAPGGVTLTAGLATTIAWTASDNGVLSGFDVLFSTNGGGSYSPVPGCSGLAGSATSCAWASPGPASANARIRVVGRDASHNGGSGESAFAIVDPAITVTAPNANVSWHVDWVRTLTWNSNLGSGQNVKIEISRDGGGSWSTIAASTPNAGSYAWTVTGPETTDARIRVSWTATPSVNDTSDVSFSIGNQNPTANAGPDQTVELGSGTVSLSGSGSDPENDTLSFEWRDEGGAIVATTASFSVSLGLGSHDYTLTVSDGFGGSASDDVRIVVQDTTPPLVTMNMPYWGAPLTVGVQTTVLWVASDNGVLGSYDVLFSTDGGSSYSPVPGCTGLSGWICNAALPGPASANARLRVVAHDASGNSGIRDWLISILDPAITVRLPNTGPNWHLGAAGTIRWYDTLGYGENVSIEISRDGGGTWTTIVASTQNLGYHWWTATGPTTTSARFRVSWAANPSVNDTSDENFTIGNQNPIANAGLDQTLELGSGPVSLLGSGSDPDNDPVSYQWRDQGGTVVATTPSFSVSLGLGAYDYTFTVSDDRGGSTSDSVHVVVRDTIAPSVTVTTPSGETITAGFATTISWTAADIGVITGFDVLYSTNGGGSYAPVPGCSGLSGGATSCAWASPGPVTANARIRVVGRDASNNNGTGESAFTIISPAITVTSPNTNVNWAVGSVREITWNHNLGAGQTVKIEISRNGGISWTTITASFANTGSYYWTVTGGTTTNARIRVSWTSQLTVNDTSDVSFTIANGLITVTVPNTAVTWNIGTQQTLTWTHNLGPSSNVKIEVSRNAGNNYSLVEASVPNSADGTSGSYVWTVTGPSTNKGRIKVTWTSNASVHDRSDVNFVIQ